MRRKKFWLGGLLWLIPATWLAAAAVSFQVDVTSRYIWRGFDLFAPNRPALQPAITWEFDPTGFALNVWCSFPLRPSDRWGDLAEIDLALEYSVAAANGVEISAGVTHYGYFFARGYTFEDNSSHEVFVSAALTKAFGEPALTIFYDFHQGDGWYLQLSASRDQVIASGWEVSLAAALGYNIHQFISTSGLSDLMVTLALRHSIGRFTISPFMSYGRVFLDEVNPDHDEVWFGLSLTG